MQWKKGLSYWMEDREELLKKLLDWALGGFSREGPDRIPAEAAANGEKSPSGWILTYRHQRQLQELHRMKDSLSHGWWTHQDWL